MKWLISPGSRQVRMSKTSCLLVCAQLVLIKSNTCHEDREQLMGSAARKYTESSKEPQNTKFLSKAEKEFFKDNGFILVRNIFTDEQLEELSQEYDDMFERQAHSDLEATWQGNWRVGVVNDAQRSVKSVHNLQFHSAVFTRMLLTDKLVDTLQDVMDTPNILLHHTKAHKKPPEKGSPFPVHQDYPYFPYKNHSMVAFFLHLDDTTPENGGLAVFPGSHKLGPLEDVSNVDGWHYVDQAKFPIEEATPVSASRGEAVIFSYLLLHGSYPNTSDRVRRMILIQVVSADDEPTKVAHKSPGQGMVLHGRNVHKNADIGRRFDN